MSAQRVEFSEVGAPKPFEPMRLIPIKKLLEDEVAYLRTQKLTGFDLAWLHECEAQLENEPRAQAEFMRQLYR